MTRAALTGLIAALTLALSPPATADDPLDAGWSNPPTPARLRAYWWWLNGNVTRQSITRDLEQMKAKGFGGALICDAGGAEQDGNDRVPHGPTFFTPEWRALYRHALAEADRLGLEMSLNIQSGWNLGGPMVRPEDAAKKLVWTEAVAQGPGAVDLNLPAPKARDGFYQDLFVVAYPLRDVKDRRPIQNWEQKAMVKALNFSAPDTSPLFAELPPRAGEQDTDRAQVVDLTSQMKDGVLRWQVPAGRWQVLRFGCTIGDHARVSTSSDGWTGYALDVLDAGAFQRYWDAVVEPLIADAGPLAGKTLRYLHTDSWEVEAVNWTPTLRDEFQKRRGYDLLPFLPVLAGRIVDSRPVANRFLFDFRKTLGDLAIDHHYRLFRDNAHRHGLEIHPESGGPHAVPIDAQRCLGWDDVPMSEFWAWSWRHRVGDPNRFFVKQPASAAHTYGHRLVAAEGFTTIGPHWQERIWNNLKPSFDKAATEGLNLLVWHAFVCSPEEQGVPGIQYFAGTHFNPASTWWNRSGPFLAYIDRCQWMLQQGLPVADVAYYYGDHVPNFTQLRSSDPARLGPGYDYDVVTEEVILTRMSAKDGRLVLPDGMSYKMLVLPDRPAISLPVLRKVVEFAAAGVSVNLRYPTEATGLAGYPGSDSEVKQLAEKLFAPITEAERARPPMPAEFRLAMEGTFHDFRAAGAAADAEINFIHRRDGDTDIYFVANRSEQPQSLRCEFRVTGKAPELWDPVSGRHRFAPAYEPATAHTIVPLDLPPCGSMFVVFRAPTADHPPTARTNIASLRELQPVAGPWTVRFDPKWGPTRPITFDRLVSWTDRPEPDVRHYSGTAVYQTTVTLTSLPSAGRSLVLDLGDVRELAAVRLNGRELGVAWTPPFQVDLTGAAKPGPNDLQVEVVNFWPNRIIGDAGLPPAQRRTRTNIRKLTAEIPLMRSGLLGPVRLLEASDAP